MLQQLFTEIMCVTYYIIDINECESEPCQNNGVCTNAINAVTCQCADGFAGEKCETSECEFCFLEAYAL